VDLLELDVAAGLDMSGTVSIGTTRSVEEAHL
jgi:hypothetical protein